MKFSGKCVVKISKKYPVSIALKKSKISKFTKEFISEAEKVPFRK